MSRPASVRGGAGVRGAARMERGLAPADGVQQEGLLAFLMNPASYPHGPRSVRLVQTHSSFVFIVPPLVYKVKKPVNFGFLDFSTLEKRRHFCEREVALNRRLCPRMYLGVVPISTTGGRLHFGAGDRVVEHAVRMRKLSDRYFMDRMLARGGVDAEDLERVVDALRRFYQAQHPTPEIGRWGDVDHLRISTDENFRQTEGFVGRTLSRPAFTALRHHAERFYGRHADLFAARVEGRWIRDCHGDLHVEHIHLAPHRLSIYDCIEFNDRLRYVDVANDVAFLAMDLDHVGRPDLARRFVERMAESLQDDGLLGVMDFYKAYRAYVRGKVETLHSLASTAPESERESSAALARGYFRQALQYAVAGSRPLVLVVMGRIASGKSTMAHALSGELGWSPFSSDRVRKEMAGYPLFERSSVDARSHLYSDAMTDRTYARLFEVAEEAFSAGRSVVVDATFARRGQRDRFRERLEGLGARVRFLELQAGDAAVKDRLRRREGRGDEVSDARLEDFATLSGLYEVPSELPTGQRIQLDADGATDAVLTRALLALVDVEVEAT